MSTKDWRHWLKLGKKQLRQLGRTIDHELGNVLERHLPAQAGRMVRIPIPVRNGPAKFPVSNVTYRNFHQIARSAEGLGRQQVTRNISQGKRPVRGGVTLFASSSRVPSGTPRGLFTNWNMTSSRFSSGRMYSTASIKFTHEAVNNMSISLRCFFNSIDGFTAGNGKAQVSMKNLMGEYQPSAKLCRKDIALIREMEVFDMIARDKMESFYAGSETFGAYVEFQVPQLDLNRVLPSLVFVNSSTLETLEDEISRFTDSLKHLAAAVRRIQENYGSLPMTSETGRLRIHFPNLTVMETEKLIVELGITLGCVHADHEGADPGPYKDNNILSNANSFNDLSSIDLNFSSILSDSCSSWDRYQLV